MDDIINSFLNEAISAPSLFIDLAKVELYIAESYRTRTLIELIQNADDAGATKFIAYQAGKDLIVANNGRVFNNEDIVSLCRSGSSTKKRGAGTIGYRGIGFKSTVGICREIEVFSGSNSFLFSKDLTKKIINTTEDVPLIRIPHKIEPTYSLPSEISKSSFNTFFILKDVNFRVINEEVMSLDSGSCIFINNINSIYLSTSSFKKEFSINVLKSKKTVKHENEEESWLVIDSPNDSNSCKIAMKFDNNEIQPATKDKALIHAFLPTKESPGAALKFNGDFSTDPSRKFVDFDIQSEYSYAICCKILADCIQKSITNNLYKGIFKIFEEPFLDGRNRLRTSLYKSFNQGIYINGSFCIFSDIRTCPEFINYTDYCNIESDKTIIPQELVEEFPEFISFLSWMGVKNFTSTEIIYGAKFKKLSPRGVISIVGNYAKKNRFTLDRSELINLSKINIIPYEDRFYSPIQFISHEGELSETVWGLIEQSEFASDIKHLLKSLNIIKAQFNKKFEFQKKQSKTINEDKSINKINIKKWRSAELNLKEYLCQFTSVLKVTDVSKAHVGYDLKVQLKSGKFLYLEVKSIKNFNTDFEITNNEFAVASDLKDNYFIALVIESENTFEVGFIKDPINNLDFEKRIKVTSWVCDYYEGKTKPVKDFL